MDPALQELFAEGAPDDEVAVILRLADDGAVPDGVRIVARFGAIATCRLQRGEIQRVRAAAAVRSMKAAHLYGPMPVLDDREPDDPADGVTDESMTDPLPGDVRRPAAALATGRGVVVAHIDWGVDFAHPDFRDEQGRTRLIGLWDQSRAADPDHPNRYGYGRVYGPGEIDAALATPMPYAALHYDPADSDTGGGSHGTHTLGISAGNGRADGPLGLAPDAHLVFVHLSTYTADGPAQLGDSVALLEALDFIARVAGPRPLVINASIGRHAGEHDGKTLVEQGMDAFLRAAAGRAIVLSTGNYFRRNTHARGMLRPGEQRGLHLVADAARRTPVEVDLWYPGVDRFGILLRGPAGSPETRAGAGEHAPVIVDGREVGRLYHRIGDPNNGDNQVALYLNQNAPPSRWELVLIGDDVADGRFHAWIERDGISPGSQAQFTSDDVEPSGTIGTICNGLRTLAVGAYDAHQDERPLARFSSCGPTRDGRQKPDLVAPGVRVLAARSSPRHDRANPCLPLLTRMSGSSMASPGVAGCVALMFEAAGRALSIEETRRLLLENCEPAPAHASALDQLRFGNGFLDTAAAVAAARRIGPPVAAPPTAISQAAPARPAAPPRSAPTGQLPANMLDFTDEVPAPRSIPMNEMNQQGAGPAPLEQANAGEAWPMSGAGAGAPAAADAADAAEAVRDRRRERGPDGPYSAPPMPFQVQLPLGGGAPALSMPIGGAASPFAFSIPLGGSPAPAAAPAAATAPPAPAPAAAAPAPAPAAGPDTPALGASLAPIAIPGLDVPLYAAPTDAAGAFAAETVPGARPLVQRGSRGPAVLEAQRKLNMAHAARLQSGAAGLAASPLVPDGVFGNNTFQAVVSLQRSAFPNQPNEWDGVVGPKTWAVLDQFSSQTPGLPGLPGLAGLLGALGGALPGDQPAIPVSSTGCGNLTIWLSAFIPASVPGYTFTVPAGPHAGSTAIPCPTAVASIANPNCFRLAYLTDQRGFDTRPGASARMRSLAEIELEPPRLVGVGTHVSSGTTEVNRNTGAVTCVQGANMGRCHFTGFASTPQLLPPGDYLIKLHLNGAASDPCVNLAADIDYIGDIEILCSPSRGFLEVGFRGVVDSFPAFEMYASLGGVVKTLFRLPPPAGNTVVDLLGGASTPVAGKVTFACSFSGARAPAGITPASAFAAIGAQAPQPEMALEAAAESAWEAHWTPGESAMETSLPSSRQWNTTEAFGSAAQAPTAGERMLEMAQAYAQAPAARPASSAALLEALLESSSGAGSEAESTDDIVLLAGGARTLSPTALFNAFVHHEHPLRPRSALNRHYARRFELLAGPGDRLAGIDPRPGDFLVRIARGEGWGQLAVIASPGLHPLDRLAQSGLRAEGGRMPAPGSYVHVVEVLPRATPAGAGFARRLADAASAVLDDTVLLRPISTYANAETAGYAPVAETAKSCGCAGAGAAAPEWAAENVSAAAPPCQTLERFGRDSASLLPAHRTQINAAAATILAGAGHVVEVTGFASSDGERSYNFALGQQRANAVATALRSALEHLRPGSSSAITIVARSRGEDEQIGGGSVVLNRRVTICVPTAAPPAPEVPVRRRLYRLTAKSFIAPIGSRVGSLSCGLDTPLGHVNSPLTNPALRALAAATDLAMSENPLTDDVVYAPPPGNRGKGYRLFSSARIEVGQRGTELVSIRCVAGVEADAGRECLPGTNACLQAPALLIDVPFTSTRIDPSRMRVTWAVRGRPPAAAEPPFVAVCDRTSVYIWHRVSATIDCSSGTPVFSSISLTGSRFPSHRLWLDGTQLANLPQGPFSGLWDEVPGDPTRVR